jgi:Tol biopolymer transport system component
MTRSRALIFVLLVGTGCSRDRSQISTLSAATMEKVGIGDSAVTLRRLGVDSGQFMPWAPSSDGRLMSGLDFETGNVAIRDLRTGDIRRLTTAANWNTSSREGEAPLISPDGRLVAYAWQNDAPSFDYELRVVGTDGSGERVLVKPNAVFVEEYPVDWAPDGRGILTLLYGRDNSARLALVSVADGGVRVIRSFDWRAPGLAKFSPDGSWIGYDIQTDEQRDGREIVLIRVNDGRETRLTSDGQPKFVVGWSSAGDGVFYRTRRDDASTIWFAPVRDGRAAGSPRLVRSDLWGAQILGTARGTLYYTVSDVRQAIYNVAVDLDAGRAIAPPAPMVTGTFVRGPAAWSPDGRHVAFVRLLDAQRFALILRDPVAGEERVMPLRLQYGEVVKWSPDGKSVLLRARQRDRWGSYRVDLATGKAELITSLGGGEQLDLSADGKTEYRTRNLQAPLDSGVVVVTDRASGAERVLYHGPQVLGPRLSPNDSLLAFVRSVSDSANGCCVPFGSQGKSLQLVTMPTAGGEPRVLYTGGVGPLSLNWTADGRRILFGGRELIGGKPMFHLTVVNVATGRMQRLLTQQEQTGGPRLSPDGRHVTFWNTVGGKRHELWAMENLPGGPRR